MGLLTQRGAPGWHPASKIIVEGCRKAVEHCKAKDTDIVKLAMQYACSHPDIATTLVSTAAPDNIRDNIAYVQEPMDEALLAEVLEILKPIQNFNFARGRPRASRSNHRKLS
jgi:L-galactose dehydrogenase